MVETSSLGKDSKLFLTDYVLCFRAGFHLRAVKPKPKYLLWPVTTDVNNTTSQSEFEANTCNWRQARESGCG